VVLTKELLTTGQAARRVGVTRFTTWKWAREGLVVDGERVRLEHKRAGDQILIAPADLDDFLGKIGRTPANGTSRNGHAAKPRRQRRRLRLRR